MRLSRIIKTAFVSACAVTLLSVSSASCFAAYEDKPIEKVTGSVLDKKTALFVGDSICYGAKETSKLYMGWAARIAAHTGLESTNNAVSGASLSTIRPDNRIITQLEKAKDDSFDYVIIHGGVNDAWGTDGVVADVGEITEGFDGPFDLDTYTGGLEEAFKFATENFKGSRIGYIINYSIPMAGYGSVNDMSAYFTLGKEICKKWNIPYIDFYFDDDFNQNILQTETNLYMDDFIHPNGAGYDLIYPRIEEWMTTLNVYDINDEGGNTTTTISISTTTTTVSDSITTFTTTSSSAATTVSAAVTTTTSKESATTAPSTTTAANKTTVTTDSGKSSTTGDNLVVAALLAVISLAAIAIIYIKKRKEA